jgi:hypothetical protein
MPNTRAYDRMLNAQLDAMRMAQDGPVKLKQQELTAALDRQQQVLTELRDLKLQRANDTSANAERLAALIGTPPPDKAATAPVIGSDRAGMSKPQGKRGMRVDRAVPSSSAAGTGLNITTGV